MLFAGVGPRTWYWTGSPWASSCMQVAGGARLFSGTSLGRIWPRRQHTTHWLACRTPTERIGQEIPIIVCAPLAVCVTSSVVCTSGLSGVVRCTFPRPVLVFCARWSSAVSGCGSLVALFRDTGGPRGYLRPLVRGCYTAGPLCSWCFTLCPTRCRVLMTRFAQALITDRRISTVVGLRLLVGGSVRCVCCHAFSVNCSSSVALVGLTLCPSC